MKKIIIIGFLLFCFIGYIFCDISADLQKVDTLHDEFKYKNENTLLLSLVNKAQGNNEQSEVYWRLARVTLYLGDASEDAGDPKKNILSFFDKGQEYADKSIQYNSGNYNAYYWKSANIGRWGQVKGIFDSLNKAAPMRDLLVKAISINPEHADSFFVLGELFDEVPGRPFSFGNMDYAVSLGRKSIILHEKDRAEGKESKKNRSFYIKLAKHLHKRGWKANKRQAKQADKKNKYYENSDILSKNFFFEGTLSLKNISDKEEALELLNTVIKELQGISNRNKDQNDNLEEALELKANWE